MLFLISFSSPRLSSSEVCINTSILLIHWYNRFWQSLMHSFWEAKVIFWNENTMGFSFQFVLLIFSGNDENVIISQSTRYSQAALQSPEPWECQDLGKLNHPIDKMQRSRVSLLPSYWHILKVGMEWKWVIENFEISCLEAVPSSSKPVKFS